MTFKRMEIEAWFDAYQFKKEYDIGESGVKFFKLGDLDIDLSSVDLRYGYHLGTPELRELIASFSPGLSASQVGVTTGAGEAIFAVMAALVGPKDHAVIEVPNFPSLYEVPASLNRGYSLFPLAFEEDFRPDIDRLKSLIKPETKLIALTHPNNPTGSVISAKELEAFIELAESIDAYLLVDETYRELSFDEPAPLAAALSPKAISITSMSKAYGIPGIRIGWVAAQEEIINAVCAVREQITICNSALGEKITLEVLRRKDAFLTEVRKTVLDNYQILKTWMEKRDDLEWVAPQGGVVAFPRLVEDVPADDMCRLLVEKYKAFVVPGFCFQMPRYFRLGFGGNEPELRAGLDRLDQALEEWKGNL
ncbi:MAG: aminotransferase class I/II-fold pyridoxal phosphate-dependent enzyme [Anaerolineaceae bacterium]|nr:aminotransferase class I/II-fold pyridoxal phosphate-dependent enzyme [Anaerolineaceae bacterium]